MRFGYVRAVSWHSSVVRRWKRCKLGDPALSVIDQNSWFVQFGCSDNMCDTVTEKILSCETNFM